MSIKFDGQFNGALTPIQSSGSIGDGVGVPGPQGPKGDKGDKGDPGVSPTVSVQNISGGHKVSITDVDGTNEFDVMDGPQGPKGDNGQDGQTGPQGPKGDDGYSPSIYTEPINNGYKLVIQNKEDEQSINIFNGSSNQIEGYEYGSILEITFEDAFVGKQFTVTDGVDIKIGTVPIGGITTIFLANCNSTYTITARANNDIEYSTEVETGPYYGQYTAMLSVFKATINVTAIAGAEVRASIGSFAYTVMAEGDGVTSLKVEQPGTYTITAMAKEVSSNSVTLDVTEEDIYTATVKFITITVTATEGSHLTLTNGSTIKTGIAPDDYIFYLPNTGDWVVTASLNADTATKTVSVTSYDNYSIELFYYKTIGVIVDESNDNPETAVTYSDNAVRMTPGYELWKDHQIFKKIRPCVVKDGVVQYYLNRDNMTEKEDGTPAILDSTAEGDVMIEIPKLGYKITNDGTNVYVSVTDDPNAEGYCYRAHSLESEGDCDFIYIGAFLGFVENSKLYSISGKTISRKIGLNNARNYAKAKGDGYQLVSFYPHTLIQCLFLIMYKNRDGQSALGYGLDNAGASTGNTNNKPFCYGSAEKEQIKFLGIEDLWGNWYYYIDGVSVNSNRGILTAFKDFNDTGSGYPYVKSSGYTADVQGFASKVQGTNEGGFISKELNGSATTGWADNSSVFNVGVLLVGNISDMSGPFISVLRYPASSDNEVRTVRLIYKHKAV